MSGAVEVVNRDGIRLIHGDVRKALALLSDKSVDCVVTSPPYWSLRDYGIEPTVWGGDEEHEHEWESVFAYASHFTDSKKKWQFIGSAEKGTTAWGRPKIENGQACECGAWLGTVGLEPTPSLYVEHIVEIFRDIRRVLKDTGTLWLNLGDCYAGSGRGGHGAKQQSNAGSIGMPPTKNLLGVKPKDLIGVPWMVAFALREDGWWLRSDIIWAKPNPMPESVQDRPTRAHEYLFLLTKKKRYHYDWKAIAEEATWSNDPTAIKNKRTVWKVVPRPYKAAHFAVFPEALVEPCIKAGCPEGGTVLDPFVGSGTTLKVARAHARAGIGIDLNREYLAIAEKRLFG